MKTSRLTLLACLLIATGQWFQVTAQSEQPATLGTVGSIEQLFVENEMIQVNTPGADVLNVLVETYRRETGSSVMYGAVQGHKASRMAVQRQGDQVTGNIYLLDTKEAYEIFTENGEVKLRATDINKLVCVGGPKAARE